MLNVCALKRNPMTRFNHVSLDDYKGFYFVSERACVYPTSYDRCDTKFYNGIYAMALKTENYLKNTTNEVPRHLQRNSKQNHNPKHNRS